jgi:hypothetical protein
MDIVEHNKRPMKKPKDNQTKTIDKNDEIVFKTSNVDGQATWPHQLP